MGATAGAGNPAPPASATRTGYSIGSAGWSAEPTRAASWPSPSPWPYRPRHRGNSRTGADALRPWPV